jgi:uncharacterized membrane protein
MVAHEQLVSGDCTFTVRPNCALGWVWMKRLFLLLAACIVAVATYFASLGAWLVLPFAGLELAVLAAGVYLNARWGATREVISLRGDDLRVARGRRTLEEVARLPRHWTRVVLLRDPRGWYPSRLLLQCHGRRIEVASSLVESERVSLAEDLRARLIFPSAVQHPAPAPLVQGLGAAEQKV